MAGPLTIRKSSVIDQITDYMRERIEKHEWKVGCIIPSEIKLSEGLGVSRSSVRSAISRLSALGILRSEQGRGCYLMSDDLSRRFGSVGTLRHNDYVDISKALQFRLLIEPYAAYRCAMLDPGARAHLVENLASSFQNMKASVNKRDAFVAADIEFHNFIASACGNELVAFALEEVYTVTPRTSKQMNVAFGYDMGLFYHEKLLDAISKGDAIRARTIMTKHLQEGLDEISGK
ncbi:MAG: FCD domain-containing protein [Succinatimonas hippei]|nr:FCD domain-containing protein [Succinatimonas hippei]